MTINISCKNTNQVRKQNLRVRVIKAPLVDTRILKDIISERAKAVVI